MTHKNYISTVFNGIFFLTLLLFILDVLFVMEIKSQSLKSFIYFGIMIFSPLILIWNLIFFSTVKRKLIGSIIPTISLVGLFLIGPLQIAFSSSAWKTQEIVYQNAHLSFKKVEFQMQDVGAFGYNERTIEVIYLTDIFMITSTVEKDIDKKGEWVKVNKEINELGLKYP